MREKRGKRWMLPRRLLSLSLAVALAVTATSQVSPARRVKAEAALSNPRMVADASMVSGGVVTWDCVWFGNYPQNRVDSVAEQPLWYALEHAKGWDANNDIVLDGVKYRRTGSSTSYSYYIYEPIKWRVLNIEGNRALLLSDAVLDFKEYNKYRRSIITWKKSAARSWLNGYSSGSNTDGVDYSRDNFIDTAFTATEQSAICNTNCLNDGRDDTCDKLFFLSTSEAVSEKHGYLKCGWRITDCRSMYARSKYTKGVVAGGGIGYIGYTSSWWLRTPGFLSYSAYVLPGNENFSYLNGDAEEKAHVRPALTLDLSSNLYSYAGTVSSAGESNSVDAEITGSAPAVPKEATAEEIVQKMNLSKLINNVSLPSEKIEGPSVTIAGKQFSLFSVDGSLNLKIGENVQAKVDTDKKQVQVLIGFDKFDGSAKIEAGENSSAYWSESYRQVKELYTGVTGKKVDSTALWNKFSKLRGKLKKVDGSIGVSASASVAGYIEFNYASGEMKFAEGGVILEAALGTEQTYHLPPFPAVYITFGLHADFNGTVKLVRNGVMNYSPSMSAGVGLDASIGAGVGSNKLKTYAEIGLQGKLDLNVKLPAATLSEALKVGLSAYVYMESKVFGFDGPSYGPEQFANVQLYPRQAKSRSIFGGADVAEFDWENASLSARDYLSDGKAVKSRAVADSRTFERENLYPYNAPQLAGLKDGKKLLVWIDDLGTKDGINKTSLMYSVYDGQTWSSPQELAGTGGANDYPAVYSDGEKAWVVWQKAGEMPGDATLPELLSGVDLYLAVWENGAFGDAVQLTSENNAYEMLQCVAAQDGRIGIAWVENSENDPFQSAGTNTIKMKEYIDGGWQERTLASGLDSAANLNLAYSNGEPILAYEAGEDETSSVYLVQGGRTKQFEGSHAELENGVLYFNSEDGLTAYDIAARFREELFAEEMGDFTVLDDGASKAIVTTAYDGFRSELRAYLFDGETGTWSEGVTLTDEGKYIRDYSLAADESGKLSAAVNFVEIQEDAESIYGAASLCVTDFGESEDLSVGGISYEEALVSPGGVLPLDVAVTNHGMQAVSEVQVEILDEAGRQVQSGSVPCELAPGETADISYPYRLPLELSRHRIVLNAWTENETKRGDNRAETEIGYADLAVMELRLSSGDAGTCLKGQIRNQGYENAEETVVTVYESGKDGSVIGSVQLGTVAGQGSAEFELLIPEVYLRMHPDISGNVLHISVESQAEELNYANNAEQYLVQSAEDAPFLLNKQELRMTAGDTETLEISCFRDIALAEKAVRWQSSDEEVVRVEDGTLTAAAGGTAVVTARIEEKEASCRVQVSAGEAVAGVCLEETTIRVRVGESRKLTASVLPENAADKRLAWESSDRTVAEVDADGNVRGVSVGTALVTVRSEDGNRTALCQATVLQAENQKYTAAFSGGENTSGKRPASLIREAGALITLPENTYRKAGLFFAGWSDGENTYQEGASYRMPYRDVEFTALWSEEAAPEYTITASADVGGSITPEGEVSVRQGRSQAFSIRAEEGYTIGDVQVDGKSVGSVAEYTFEEVSENHTIQASFNRIPAVKVQGITLNESEYTLNVGETVQLTASVFPGNAGDRSVSWKSEHEEIANVKNGMVTAVSPGDTVITAESVDGSEVSASCTVHVAAEPDKTQPENPDKDQPQNPGGNQTEAPDKNQPAKPNPSDDQKPDSRLKEGSILTDSRTSAVCRITRLSPGEAEYIGCAKKKAAVTVPDSVTADGRRFAVTGIAKSALKGNKKLKSVVVGKNVKTIGEKAFYGCKSLKKLTIKSKVLKKVGKNVFKGIHVKARIKVPKAKLKAYKKLLKKKGQGRNVKIGR